MRLINKLFFHTLLILIFSLSFGVIIVSFLILYGIINMNLRDALMIYFISISVIGLLITVMYIIRFIIWQGEKHLISDVMYKDGVTPLVLLILKKRIERCKFFHSRYKREMELISILCEGGFYRRCFEELDEIDADILSEREKAEYYCMYAYINIVSGDIKSAEKIYNLIYPLCINKKNALFLHISGIIEYIKNNFDISENYFIESKAVCRNDYNKCENNICLGYIYVRTGRIQEAEKMLKEAIKNMTNIYQKEKIQELIKLFKYS